MKTVLIVEDEKMIRQGIKTMIMRSGVPIETIMECNNGETALEILKEQEIDVMFTDIRMPKMDGIELVQKMQSLEHIPLTVAISGYDDFAYAVEMLRNGVREYILKPINSNELREVFERIKVNLDKELDEKRNIDKLREYYMESLPVLQENFYTSLIEGRIPESQIEKYVQNYQINLTGPYYVVTVLHISTTNPENVPIDPFLLTVSVKKLAEEQLTEKWNCRTVTYLGDILVIAQLSDVDSVTHFTDDMDRFCKMAKRVCKATVTAGIGHVCNQLSQLSLSYHGAKNATSYRVLYGNTRAINIAEMDPQESVDEHWEEAYIEKILKKVKMGEQEPLEEAIAEFTGQMAKTRMSLQNYRILVMELIAEIFRFGSNNQINMDEVFGNNSDLYNQALQLESTDALGAWLKENCMKMQRQVTNERQDTTKSFVTRAVEYVKEHYADQELSIETICSYLNVSAAYFSTVFKKETGKTFINYLTDYRMEQAVDLLLTKDEKTYIIAEKVGYSDPNYFSYVFKKQFGMSPSKYKAGKLGEK